MKTENEKSEVLANELISVALYNVNGEELKKTDLLTNDFGSVHGEFILPNGGLNGQYSVIVSSKNIAIHSSSYFSVEEYKRPKFEVKFNSITKTFKINDSIGIKGNALAFAGSTVSDAKVVYRVKRNVQYPRWYYWYKPWYKSESQEITHGELITNEKGEFEITFKAIPNAKLDKSSLPIFNYEITADITDLNGETRSATTTVNVGYHALIANMFIANRLDKTDKNNTIEIKTKNLNGEFVATKGNIKIYKLQSPKRVLRPRPWQAPDYQIIKKEDFITKFPHEAYADEHNVNKWGKGKLVFDKKFNTGKQETLALGNIKKWQSGQYIIILESKDKFGQLVKNEIRTSLYNNTDKTVADNQLFSITTNKGSYAINDTIELCVSSAAENLTITLDIEKDHRIVKTYIIPLNNNKQTISIPVTKTDVGGFAILYSYAFQNSYKSGTKIIAVPYPKTDLEIETQTFRDKLEPGTDETWSFKIKGPKGNKVSAELLASMYDASLNQFKAHNWIFNPLRKLTYYSHINQSASQSFKTQGFRIYNRYKNPSYFKHQVYDKLNWFGFYFGNAGVEHIIRGRAAGVAVTSSKTKKKLS